MTIANLLQMWISHLYRRLRQTNISLERATLTNVLQEKWLSKIIPLRPQLCNFLLFYEQSTQTHFSLCIYFFRALPAIHWTTMKQPYTPPVIFSSYGMLTSILCCLITCISAITVSSLIQIALSIC